MSNENELDDLRGQVVEMQQQLSQAATASRMPVLDMSQMMTTREYHRQLVEARSAPQPVRPQSRRLTGSIVPASFGFTLSAPNADLEAEVRGDVGYQVEAAHYAKAREQWWAALSHGDRRAIDYAGMELIARHAAATGAVYGVAIRGYKGEIARLKAQVEFLQTQGTRLEQETRDHKQRADAMELAHLTTPPAIPDLKITVALPSEIAVRLAPSGGTTVEYDGDGKVIGTRPRVGQ